MGEEGRFFRILIKLNFWLGFVRILINWNVGSLIIRLVIESCYFIRCIEIDFNWFFYRLKYFYYWWRFLGKS